MAAKTNRTEMKILISKRKKLKKKLYYKTIASFTPNWWNRNEKTTKICNNKKKRIERKYTLKTKSSILHTRCTQTNTNEYPETAAEIVKKRIITATTTTFN